MMETLAIANEKTGLKLSIGRTGAGNVYYTLIDANGVHLASCKRSIEMFRILQGIIILKEEEKLNERDKRSSKG